jgi:hypothetical protein
MLTCKQINKSDEKVKTHLTNNVCFKNKKKIKFITFRCTKFNIIRK